MSIREQLFTSFIKGIGKTSGAVTIFGLLGATWYFYNKNTNSLTIGRKEKTTETGDIVLHEVELESETEGQSTQDEITNVLENFENNVSKNTKRDFRKIFDGM
jgi:hypothetical protein